LYGRRLALRLHTFLRAEKKFESIDQLVEQISSDAERAKEIFAVKIRD
jgi:riboflavin kinase/FMN adenylyltransferase